MENFMWYDLSTEANWKRFDQNHWQHSTDALPKIDIESWSEVYSNDVEDDTNFAIGILLNKK